MGRIVFLFLFRNRSFGITPGSLEPVISISKYLVLFCGPLLEGYIWSVDKSSSRAPWEGFIWGMGTVGIAC